MRDIAYEQAPMRHRRKMLRILDDYSQENADSWTERDFLAIQRALQVFIESFIGMARYFVEQKYQLSVSQSREALDELKSRGVLTSEQHGELMKIIDFRNVPYWSTTIWTSTTASSKPSSPKSSI
ncbi:HepT-like ribonuclease domain-containing protein [Methylomonas koyamae]|uniref:HepT-like ribonuclease domain-containing protein n=1 Tax=Methylomonas koyamae TaxID=702114 RepID=UPI000AE5E47F|nr:HepT-like ribonuclease domain-containing protein [Methylomonas koyamae]